MDDGKVFLARVKRSKEGVYEKGLEVRNSMDDANQGFHAYMAAYAYGHDSTVDYVHCLVFDQNCLVRRNERWPLPGEEPNVEPTPEPNAE